MKKNELELIATIEQYQEQFSDKAAFMKIRDFIVKNLNNNGNFINKSKPGLNWDKHAFPYKPFLMIAIMKVCNDDPIIFFNKEHRLDNKLIKQYYDLMTENSLLFKKLTEIKSNAHWALGLGNHNKEIITSIRSNILNCPVRYILKNNLKNNNECFNKVKTNGEIAFIFDFMVNESDINIAYDMFKACVMRILYKCIPEYEKYNFNNLGTLDSPDVTSSKGEAIEREAYGAQFRPGGHAFAKRIKDRDEKCLICCNDLPPVLQACHIKPYSKCSYMESIDDNNGITLCANHHKLFDSGMFTFNEDATIKISEQYDSDDLALRIKAFEPCYSHTLKPMHFSTNYYNYHRHEIFIN